MSRGNGSAVRVLVAEAYWWAQVAAGSAVVIWTALHWHSSDHLRFCAYLASAVVAAILKVRLPGVTGAASVSFLFLLIGIVDLSPSEAIALAGCAMLAQCTWRTQRRPRPRQVAFSVANIIAAVYVSTVLYRAALDIMPEPLALGALAAAYYVTNTVAVACIIALTEAKPLTAIVRQSLWLAPYYACATSMAWMIGAMPHQMQWELPIICLPIVYVVHRSHRTLLAQLEQEKEHVEELNRVHMRTIEALALAIDAKDHTTHDHLQRVQLYAVEIGKELGLNGAQLDAVRAASVLHDIGKLAVPEHIISKPGKLTPAEFQKMKIHPVVGAEILERVAFPYPVVPIVRSHHEKWDGSGYPDGLKGEEIPIGARILSAVDCFDALASDRQYRRALPLDEAIAKIVSESGTSFDPAVVEVLQRRYRELEETAKRGGGSVQAGLSTDICITRGAAPAAGFAVETAAAAPPGSGASRPVRSYAAEAALAGLSVEEALAVLAVRVKASVAYDGIAVFASRGDALECVFTGGKSGASLESLRARKGVGFLGWVAQSGRPIANANPEVDEGTVLPFRSALAMPIVTAGEVGGVVAVYREERDAFGPNELSALTAHSRSFGRVLESGGAAAKPDEKNALAVAV